MVGVCWRRGWFSMVVKDNLKKKQYTVVVMDKRR